MAGFTIPLSEIDRSTSLMPTTGFADLEQSGPSSDSLAAILQMTAAAIDRRVLWALELMALTALASVVGLLPRAQTGIGAAAVAIAVSYFAVSAAVGACLLKVDTGEGRRIARLA
jgi:hypothetical protein